MSAVAATPALKGTWAADPVHSSVGFEIEHLGVSTFRGRFRDYVVVLVAAEEDMQITGVARVEGIDVGDAQLLAHLLSPDFFDADREPEIRFEASQVRLDGDQLTAKGELTIRGQSQPVEARGRIGEPGLGVQGEERVALELETTIDRRDFGIDINMELPNGRSMLGTEVRLVAQLELVREVSA